MSQKSEIEFILERIRELPAFKELINDIQDRKRVPGLGLLRSVRLPFVALMLQDLDRPILYITDKADRGLALAEEAATWIPENSIQFFQEPNPLFYEQAAWGSTVRRDRILSLASLITYQLPTIKSKNAKLIIAPIRAVMTRTLSRREFIKASQVIKTESSHSINDLISTWVKEGYIGEETVTEPGQFSKRGGLLDIWPPSEDQPLRLDFFGDKIESIRKFDPKSQLTIANLEEVFITPAREVISGRIDSHEFPSTTIDEFQIPILHPFSATILDYLPPDSLILMDEKDVVESTAQEIEEQSVVNRMDSIKEGTLAEDFPIPYQTWSELADILAGKRTLEMGFSDSEEASSISQYFSPGPRFGGRLKQVMEYLVEGCRKQTRFYVISRQLSRLEELWKESKNQVEVCDPVFSEGNVHEGWKFNSLQGPIEFLTDGEIFGWVKPQPRARTRLGSEAPESIFGDLKPGDAIVHIDYGIGIYEGLVKRTLEGVEKEYLVINYEGGDQLFVPIYQADRLSRYIGPYNETPSLSKLGSGSWNQTKEKVKEEAKQVARDLLDLYSRRQVAKGFQFSKDTVWQNELEGSFQYIETKDQVQAIQEVKKDMENARPMDRLLCGDVGYGKTEVALRAAFKAVQDGKQVGMLVPTTVLAAQHYETFRQRLAAFPINIEMLSRFRSPKEQDEIIKSLSEGKIDIIIGTHRLLTNDVSFRDLGLLIIDEEQRFGVSHKEHFKKLRTEIDVLTLTATPIPRTLYMALTGVRDISSINTPPAERQPVVTHIGPYSPRMARQAIIREIERGGQVFFVHNRVQTIHAMRSHIHQLVPEARIGIAHGQMPEHELAKVMEEFTAGEVDVLLCTSIIESGLDIPNANTLIVDRGDTFGLAQLYQLRGRVGRGAMRAYAYFFRHRNRPPTEEGNERLEVIAENTQLGSGYSIAMRDLEMRGAGDLLGVRQSGYIASVGFHLYTRILAQAVRGLKKTSNLPIEAFSNSIEERAITSFISVDLPLSIGLPIEIFPEQELRLRLYRRMGTIESLEEAEAFLGELMDRYGKMTDQVLNLFYQIKIKILASKAGLSSVTLEGNQIVLRYPQLPENVKSRNLNPMGQKVRTGNNAYWLEFDRDSNDWMDDLVVLLGKLPSQESSSML